MGADRVFERERNKKGRVIGKRMWLQKGDERAPELNGNPGMRIFREVILAPEGHA